MVITHAAGRSSFTLTTNKRRSRLAEPIPNVSRVADKTLCHSGTPEIPTHKIIHIPSPVSRIPPEVLSMIFLHLSDQWPTTYGLCGQESDCSVVLGWAVVSHVSHHWRVVSLDYPRLWSSLCLQSPKWTAIQLERTRNAPISLRVPGRLMENGREILDEILASHLHRMQYLSILLIDESLTRELANILSRALVPQLESLTLKRSTKLMKSLALHHPDLIVPPHNFLANGAPSLRHLVLTSWDIAWSSPILTGLTSLAISSRFSGGLTASGTLSDLLESLDRMPHLETLALAAPLPPFDGTGVDRIVELRNLRKLELRAECHDCDALLRHLAFPSSASVDLSCMGFANPPSPIMISRMISAIHSAPIRGQRSINTLWGTSTGTQVFQKLEIFRFREPVDHFVINLRPIFAESTTRDAAWSVCFDGSDSSVEAFLSFLPLAGLRSVSLDAAVGVGVLEILSNLPSLASMWLSDDNVSRFLTYMYKEDPMLQVWPLSDLEGLPSLSADNFCPNRPSTISRFVGLTDLGFEEIQLCHSIHEKTSWDLSKISEGQLLRFLSVRSMHMKPIQEILFRECVDMLPEKLELLRAVVPYVGIVYT